MSQFKMADHSRSEEIGHADSHNEETSCTCLDCNNEVGETDKALACETCENWFHISCQNIPEQVYDFMVEEEEGQQLQWFCKYCKRGSVKLHNRIRKIEEK